MEPAHTILHRITTGRVSVEPSGDGLLVRWDGEVAGDAYFGASLVDSLEVNCHLDLLGNPTLTITCAPSRAFRDGNLRVTREITAGGAWNACATIRTWADRWRTERAVTEWLDRIGDLVRITPVRIDVTDITTARLGDAFHLAARVAGAEDDPPYTFVCRRDARTTVHSGPTAFAIEYTPTGVDNPVTTLAAFVGTGLYDPASAENALREWLGPRTINLTGYVKDVTITFAPDAVNTEAVEGVLADTAMFVARWYVVPPEQSWDDLLDHVAALPCEHTCHISASDLYRLVRAARGAAMLTVDE